MSKRIKTIQYPTPIETTVFLSNQDTISLIHLVTIIHHGIEESPNHIRFIDARIHQIYVSNYKILLRHQYGILCRNHTSAKQKVIDFCIRGESELPSIMAFHKPHYTLSNKNQTLFLIPKLN